MQVQDEVHVSLTDGPPTPWPGLPPLLTFVLVLLQDGLELWGVVEDHGQDILGQTQEQAHRSKPDPEGKRAPHDNTAATGKIILIVWKTIQGSL